MNVRNVATPPRNYARVVTVHGLECDFARQELLIPAAGRLIKSTEPFAPTWIAMHGYNIIIHLPTDTEAERFALWLEEAGQAAIDSFSETQN